LDYSKKLVTVISTHIPTNYLWSSCHSVLHRCSASRAMVRFPLLPTRRSTI